MSKTICYENGSYTVRLDLSDGTKTRVSDSGNFLPNRPESADVKITSVCSRGCPFCHEGCASDGGKADIETMTEFALSCPAGMEIAVGGGNLMEDISHTESFLYTLRKSGCIPSITLHQDDFLSNLSIISNWQRQHLIYGIGVSLHDAENRMLIPALLSFPNAILHVIAGVFDEKDMACISDKNIQVLVLGYKNIRRGQHYLQDNEDIVDLNMKWLSDNIEGMRYHFKGMSFDNLAIEQLSIRKKISEEVWKKSYLGDDGQYSFFVDLVKREFTTSSSSLERYSMDIADQGKGSMLSVSDMFDMIKDR